MSSIDTSSFSSVQQQWEMPLDARQWDERFPGMMDGIGLLGGLANVVMQLALSPVGYGVKESTVTSGSIMHHPIKRARTTFTYLSVAMIGTTEEKLAYRKAINRAHAQVRSTEDSPVKYNAFDPELQLWVAACLYYGFADSWVKFRGPQSEAELREFYKYAMPLGTTLQVRADMWPADLDAYNEYWHNGLSKLQIDPAIREFLMQLVELKFASPVTHKLFGGFAKFITTGFLPQEIRDAMQLEWSPEQDRRFKRFTRIAGAVNSRLPRVVRQFPYNIVMWDFRRRMRNGLPMI